MSLCVSTDFYFREPRGAVRLKLRAVGALTGVILPKEILHRLKVNKGDFLLAAETPDGYHLTRYDPDEDQLRIGLEFMAEYRDIFRALAKM
jgi:putative addiction module antidote